MFVVAESLSRPGNIIRSGPSCGAERSGLEIAKSHRPGKE